MVHHQISVSIGIVLIFVFLFNELVVNPLFETIKNKLIIVRLRKLLSLGMTLQMVPENALAKKFGLSTGIRAKDIPLFICKLLKIFVKLFVLLAITWWESGLSQTVTTKSRTVSLKLDALSRRDGSVSFASVTPHVPLTERMVLGIPVFESEMKMNTGPYMKSRNAELELHYFSDCVQDNGDGLRAVYGALARPSPTNESQTEVVCLNGIEGRDKVVLLTFDPNNANAKNVTIESMEFLRNVTTDGPSILFAVRIRTRTKLLGTSEFMGYATLTARSHFDNNVAWSLYGFAVAPNKELLRIIVVVNDDLINGRPCSVEECLGTWKFSEKGIILPSGMPIENFYAPVDCGGSQLESIGLKLRSGIREQRNQEEQLALSWLAEMDYGLFRADKLFANDILRKLTGNMFFFSDMGVQTRSFKAFDSKSVTEIADGRTVPLLSSLTVLLVFAVIGGVAELRSRKNLGIRSEVITREALVGMYKCHVFSIACCDSNTEVIDIGITNTDENEQNFGLIDVSTRKAVARTKSPLGPPSSAKLEIL